MFRKHVLLSFTGSSPPLGLVDPEDGEAEILRNLGKYLPTGVAQRSGRYEPSVTSP